MNIRRIWRDNGLSIVLVTATMATIAAMSVAGWSAYNQNAVAHHAATIGFWAYLASGHFLSALFENWESEFLQMSAYVCLTAFLFQKGSAESRDPEEPSPAESLTRRTETGVPWPLRRGKVLRTLYAYSLGITLAALFVLSFFLHLLFSAQAATTEAAEHAQPVTWWWHVGDAQFWFESFQNWQSEFLSTMILVILSIFLRFRGSPESKPLAASNSQTGA